MAQQQQQQQEAYVPRFDNMEPVNVADEDEDEEEPDFTPLGDDEVQEIAPQKSSRSKPINWSPHEEEDLMKAYVDCTEDQARSNEQTFKSYWIRVTNKFNSISRRGLQRTRDQVYSKWGDLNRFCGWFNGFYLSIRDSHPSGTNEADLIRRAHVEYEAVTKKRFRWVECWDIMRGHPKWEAVPFRNANPPKRTKTNATNAYTTSSGADFSPANEGEFDPFLSQESPTQPSPPQPSPSQRRRGKQTVSASSGSTAREEMIRKFDDYSKLSAESRKEYRDGKLRMAQELHQQQLDILKRKDYDMDFDRFLAPHEHLTGTALRMTLEYKKRIAEKWGWEFNP